MAPSTRSTTRPPHLGVTRARQGRLGRHVLWVLLVALLLVVLGFFATWTWQAQDLASCEISWGVPARLPFLSPLLPVIRSTESMAE